MRDQKKESAMRLGGERLHLVKQTLLDMLEPGVTFEEIEAVAQKEIRKRGDVPSFSTVPGYHWATCVMKNDELCHGIPQGKKINEGDIITVDVGLIHQGYHLDTTATRSIGKVPNDVSEFLERGKKILAQSIAVAIAGNSVYDISNEMERRLKRYGYGAVRQLTGHGIGTELHMFPSIPVFTQRSDKKIRLNAGQTLAIEIMYTMGDPLVEEAKDGWTFVTCDGSLAAMFEETVLVTDGEPEILT